MENLISESMIDEFNNMLRSEDSFVRLRHSGVNVVYIELEENPYVKNDLALNFTNEFYERLNSFFLEKGLKLSYNNTRTTFWCFG